MPPARIFVLPLALVLALAMSSPAAADAPVTVSCGDGSSFSVNADVDTLAQLQSAVQAMIDHPAGVSCSLSQTAVALSLGNSSDGDFAVGGGSYGFKKGFDFRCWINFGLSAHINNGRASGTQTLTQSAASAECGGEGHVKANITCLQVSENFAEMRGDILEATGSLGPDFFPPGSAVLVTQIQDNGNGSSATPDRIIQFELLPGTESGCSTGGFFDEPFTVDNGNVSVHDR
jgi:hypothetical protein